MSIGVLGFVVWSWFLASPLSDKGINLIYFAICWNGLALIGTLYGKNPISYTQSAGNLSLYLLESKIQSASETTRETSFNFLAFRLYYKILFGNKANHSDNWLAWFIGFVEERSVPFKLMGKVKRYVLFLPKRKCYSLSYTKSFRYRCCKAFSTREKWRKKWFLQTNSRRAITNTSTSLFI